ncbi:nitroreductase family protein [Candidatus Bipolaricaulota bacterium]|jgi:nitroreductase|nr:nitroreductase family protein [Candidatus Bipolaricaulota bacterium]TFH08485.1 MAG: nitroreductase family protein [Candidatus Atribacteria bacterium]
MNKSILQLITKRRSIRKFTGEAVDRELLATALRAAMAAPSARNSRPWNFLVITALDRVKAICRAHPYAAFGEEAGAVILPFGKKEGYAWFDQDMAAATENLLIALANLGLGATWCGMTDQIQAGIRAVVSLPDEVFIFALIPVGIPAELKEPRTQYEDARVHWDDYSTDS